jgi:hypothetical protein
VFVLACGSLGLIGLSRFLQCSVPFFCPPFSAVFAVFALVIPLRYIPAAHTAKQRLSQAREPPFIRSFRFVNCTSFTPSSRLTCFSRKKTPLHSKKTRQPCVFHVGSRSPHSATLHCGLSASATLAPLAGGSRLYTTQAKKSLHCVTLIFYLFRSGSRLFYLRVLCYAHTSPRPPTPEIS